MTYLTRPRAHFYGKLMVNMPTGNNASADYRNRPYFEAAQSRLDLQGGTPAQFREWLHQLNPSGYVNGGWNYYGDNGIWFDKVAITSVELPEQEILTRPEQDGSIGARVRFAGNPYRGGRTPAILVDMDPNDGFTTQMIGHQLTVSQNNTPLITAISQVKAYSRWLNAWRSLELGGDRGAAAFWQFAFPAESLEFQDTSDSPFLAALHEASRQKQGIVVRLCTWLFQHLPYREIARQYREGRRFALPGALLVMGTIGVWQPDEPATLPLARLLLPDIQHPLPIPPEVKRQRRGQTFYPGVTPALVDTARKIITLDLVNTFPEMSGFETLDEDHQSASLPEKIDLGTLSLQVSPGQSGPCLCIGALPFADVPGQAGYNRAAYLLTGGIVEIPYPPEMEQTILEGDLVLLQGMEPDSPVVLRENPYHVLIDRRGVYLELEETAAMDIPVRVLVRGQPAPAGLILPVEQTVNFNSQPREAASDTDANAADADNPASSEVVSFSPVIVTDADGNALLTFQPARAGMGKLWVNTPGDPDWTAAPEPLQRILRAQTGAFVNYRVLPDDRRYDRLPDEQLTWDLMYQEVFRYYSLLYPAMNAYINFDDEAATRAAAERIVQFIAPALKDTTIYMPITRDLSAGKRRLLERWAERAQRQE